MPRALAGFLVLVLPAPLPAQHAVTQDVGLDHVILATGNLDRGIAEFARRTGITPRFGGQHPGRGTRNALASLSEGSYLELLAPIESTADSAGALAPAGWALHTRDLDALIKRVQAAGFPVTGPVPGSRLTPDGAMLRWRTASSSGPGLEALPFFIEWESGTPHPSTSAPGGCRLSGLTLSAPDTSRLRRFFAAAGYSPALLAGPTSHLHLTLDCPQGKVRFGPA